MHKDKYQLAAEEFLKSKGIKDEFVFNINGASRVSDIILEFHIHFMQEEDRLKNPIEIND